jgi:hypothetical protein
MEAAAIARTVETPHTRTEGSAGRLELTFLKSDSRCSLALRRAVSLVEGWYTPVLAG